MANSSPEENGTFTLSVVYHSNDQPQYKVGEAIVYEDSDFDVIIDEEMREKLNEISNFPMNWVYTRTETEVKLRTLFETQTEKHREVPESVKISHMARSCVRDYINAHLDESDGFPPVHLDAIYVVWQCRILRNWKFLVSSDLPDGMYYEVTYDGPNNKIYLDVYKKFQNVVIDPDKLYSERQS